MSNYNVEFQNMKNQLLKKGYKEKNVTFSSGKAMGLGFLYALPFVIVFSLVYRFLLIDRAHLSEIGGISFYIMLIVIIALSAIIHELLHGIGWTISSGKGWGAVRFNINAMIPSCACKAALEKRQYLVGVLAPFVVLGVGSVLFIFIYPGTISLLTMIVNFIAAGADLIIALNVIKESGSLIVDHPTAAGYISFYK
ncbi:MAG: DUF3267 domain-containing protein [Lachnospiraceae bacterium]